MFYFEKLSGRRVRLNGKTYHVALVASEIRETFTLKLCLNQYGSILVHTVDLKKTKEQTEGQIKIITAQYLGQKGGVGKMFPKLDDDDWEISRPYLVHVVRGPCNKRRLIGTVLGSRRNGARVGRNLWKRRFKEVPVGMVR